MKSWVVGAAIAAFALPVAGAAAQQLPLPPLVMSAPADAAPANFPLPERYYLPPADAFLPEQVEAEAKTGATVPMWSATVRDGISGKTFHYTMIGQNPRTPLQHPAISLGVRLVPVVFTFPGNVVFDPTTVDQTCSPDGSALDLSLASPMFTNLAALTFPDGTNVGSGQYPSLFQRGNFFKFVGPGGINPDFALVLKPNIETALAVPVSGGAVMQAPCGQLGEIDIDSWDTFVRTKVFHTMRASLTPKVLPLFLFYNVVMFQGKQGDCCILGYHSAFSNPSHGNNVQTYAVAAYISAGAFQSADVATMSHEVDEWQDDPLGNNRTPPWGHIGQVSGCSRILEVGDPLTGTTVPITMGNGVTYHVQDLAFFSWFFHQSPSIGVEGLYSLFGNFSSYAAPCP
jgi:hypothetical protein